MVTSKEKDLIYKMIDTIQAAYEMSKEMRKMLGIEEDSKFEIECRESISTGYKVIKGNAESD